MNYIVLDLEYNQPSGVRASFRKAKYIKNEIIEIGATKLDNNLNFIKGFRCYVKPYYYPVINQQVLKLLGFENQDYININGTKLKHAIELFKDFVGTDDFTIIEWGNNDIPVLKQNCNITPNADIQWFTCKKVIDIQQNYIRYKNLKQYPSLGKVVKELNISVEENKLHHAFQDSLYTAKILQKLGRDFIENTFPYCNFVKIPKELLTKINIIAKCPKCGRFSKVRAIKRPFLNNSKQIETNKLSFCSKCNIYISEFYKYSPKHKNTEVSKKSSNINHTLAVNHILKRYEQ